MTKIYWQSNRRTVYDPQTGQDVILSNEDVELIKNVMGSRIPDGSYNPYEPWVDWFTNEVMETPVTGRPEHKRSFIPSRVEAIKGNTINLLLCVFFYRYFSNFQSVEWFMP